MKNKYLNFLYLFAIFILIVWFFLKKENETINIEISEKKEAPVMIQEKSQVDLNYPVINEKQFVPFVLQAPSANWKDPLFQDACEEAAILMVAGWLEERKYFTEKQIEEGIRKIAMLEDETLKEHVDSSIKDTLRILEKYIDLKFEARVIENIKISDIQNELRMGNLVIVPTDGRKLSNPFFVSPGPITHMLVLIEYDEQKKQFIVNDSGTRNGAEYHYDEKNLFNAIRDYPTGNHHVNLIDEKTIEKTMIVVKKEKKQ